MAITRPSVELSVDEDAGAGYLRLAPRAPGSAVRQVAVADSAGADVLVVDFGADGQVLGIEFLDPARQIPALLREDRTP
ncbi:DUF2283 domain-containing protein [Pseudonocardia sp. WMMC193]|uniref:DUF2283 domain-containing protein n=1 Tax=Pseudonocardia sp. WMMC193 TaxID=2911965 RepID=UPI001F338014|nr:DUF2283 domain-containing protein [Pseudonocardia sp. WMMC193]MCF7551054.1 DUF2283 domain-containing protein [Pseudonocardia sp. WMMC193]